MPMWIDVTAPQKKLPRGQHWMTYNLLKSVCSVFRFDHHFAVQFLLRYLVHPNYNFSIPAHFNWIKCNLSKGWEIYFTMFWPVVFNEYAVYLKRASLFKFQENRAIFVCALTCLDTNICCHQFSLKLRRFLFVCVCETNYSPGWIEKGTWIGSRASCSAAHGRWRGHGSCQEDCKSSWRIIVWQRTRKTNWAAYCNLWSEQNTKLLPTGTWMENTSKGISQSFFLFFFLKDPNSFVHSPENNSVLHALSVSFTNRLEDLRPKWRSGWVLVIVL